jgi:DNA topoisomerase-1
VAGNGMIGSDGKRLGLKAAVAAHLGDIDAREINSIPIGAGADGVPIVARVGRYGPYLQRGDDRASLPDDMAPDELTVERSEELLAAPTNDRVLGVHPEHGLDVSVKAGRFGPYVQLGEAGEGAGKPRTSSLFSTHDPATLTFEQALELLRIPRLVGTDPESGEEVVAHNGKFGPYLKKGADTRSLTSEDQILSVTLPEAQAIFAQPKQRRGRTAAAPLRELGVDPATELPVVVKEGRFGPYVTDGTTNASLRKGDVVESITMDRASELLAERRAAGPSTRKKGGAKKAGAAKKATKKAPAAKKAGAAKKATGVKKATKAKKTVAKKTAEPLEPF